MIRGDKKITLHSFRATFFTIRKIPFYLFLLFFNQQQPHQQPQQSTDLKAWPPTKVLWRLKLSISTLKNIYFISLKGRRKFWRSFLCQIHSNEMMQLVCRRLCQKRSVTRLGDLLHFGQLFRGCGNNYFAQIVNIFRYFFCKGVKNFHFLEISFLGNFYKHLATFNWSHCKNGLPLLLK